MLEAMYHKASSIFFVAKSGSARGLDALLARVTVVLAVLFGVITLFIAKLTSL